MSFGRWLWIGAALALSSAPVYGDVGHVEWREGRLSVNADGVPFRELLAAIANTTGVEFRGLRTLEGNASVQFSKLTLRDGLRALLTRVNYAMLEEPSAHGEQQHFVVLVVGQRYGAGLETSVGLERDGVLQESERVTADGSDTYRAVERLAEQGDVRALREAAAFGDATTQALAMQRLARQDPAEARRAATVAAGSAEATRRVLALQVLGGLDGLDATNALGAALLDADADVRQAAVVGLIGHPSPTTFPFLVQALQDPRASIRVLAQEILARKRVSGVAAAIQ